MSCKSTSLRDAVQSHNLVVMMMVTLPPPLLLMVVLLVILLVSMYILAGCGVQYLYDLSWFVDCDRR